MDEVAPGGRLRVAVAVSPAPGPFWAGRDAAGMPCGVTVELGRAMAAALGAAAEIVVFANSGAITEAGATGAWDVTFVPMDAARAARLDFGPVYNVGESTFLVRPGTAITRLEEVDRSGVRVVGIAETTTIRAMRQWLTQTEAVGLESVEVAMARLRDGTADAFGMSRDSLDDLARDLPGSHVLPGFFFQARTAVAVPQGRPAALTFVAGFMREATASGLLRRVLDANGVAGQGVE